MSQSPLLITFSSALSAALQDLDSSLSDLTAKHETQIAVKDTEIANLRATITKLGARLDLAQVQNAERGDEIVRLNDRINVLLVERSNAQLELAEALETIRILETELAARPPIDPPPPPPIEVSPDITITLDHIGSFRPGLKGERQGQEVRYRGSLNNEIDIVLDLKDDGQVAVAIERCWADLPFTAQPIETTITAHLGESLRRDQFAGRVNLLRLHHHTRPRFIVNPSPPPKLSIISLIDAGLIPSYDLSTVIPESDLSRIALGQHPWPTSKQLTIFSEDYGQIVNSWSGGAGPLLNEAAHLMPVQVVYLLTQDPRAWNEVLKLANSSGNYAIHYRLRSSQGGYYPTQDEFSSLPFLQSPDTVTLKSQSGDNLPIPTPSHEHSLVYLAALLTGERYYREELEAWCVYNLLTRPRGPLRDQGIIWSGQVRSAAWSLRALLHAFNAHALFPPKKLYYEYLIRNNLNWMNSTFTDPESPEYRSTGVCSLLPFRIAPQLQYVTLNPRPRYFATWQHHVLASVLNECVRAGFNEAIPIRNHLLKVVEGVWVNSPSRYLIGWGNHAFDTDNWTDIIRTTFEGAAASELNPTTFPSLTTPDYLGWARSGVVAGIDARRPLATSALSWIDTEAPKYKGGIPLVWKINPSI